MTYNVSSGTLNTTVPYRTRLCPSYNCLTVSADNTRAMQLFKILSSRRGFTRWLYRCLLMLIMRIVQIIRRSFVCRQSILVGQWPDRPSIAAVSGRSAAGPSGPRVSDVPLPQKLRSSVKVMLAAGDQSRRR